MGEQKKGRDLPWGVYRTPFNKKTGYISRFRFEGVSVYIATSEDPETAHRLTKAAKKLSGEDREEFLRLFPSVERQLARLRKRERKEVRRVNPDLGKAREVARRLFL